MALGQLVAGSLYKESLHDSIGELLMLNGVLKPIEVLLIEDNAGDIRLTREALRDGKLAVNLTVAMDGIEAGDILHHCNDHANASRPDLILLDLNLPKKDGRQLLLEIKQDAALMCIPVVVLTTSNAESDIQATYGAQANCYITKPIDMDQLLSLLRVWLYR